MGVPVLESDLWLRGVDLDRAIVEGVPDWVALAPMNVSHAVLM
ncbi:hypothetical protein ACFR97_16625 [Haloplanus litoreus]|uniref:Uncharacterized protein n=1 Tax=Haloplanus litoreus TaxID=767515 RepID=A0ABD6A2H5_9EURY